LWGVLSEPTSLDVAAEVERLLDGHVVIREVRSPRRRPTYDQQTTLDSRRRPMPVNDVHVR
jgi:hypothetical protein